MPNDEEPEIRIKAYTGMLFEGPCMRQGCINRLRRIVELEDSLKRLEPSAQLLKAREALGCHENVDLGYACREAVKDRDLYRDECVKRAASESRLIEALKGALSHLAGQNWANRSDNTYTRALAALKGAE